MAKRKSWSVRIKERTRQMMSVLTVFLIVCVLLTFDKLSAVVAQALNTTPERVEEIAVHAGWISFALIFVLLAGITASVPFIGISFAVIAGTILIWRAIEIYNEMSENDIDLGR